MCSIVVWDVGGTLVDYAIPVESFLRRCLALAGVSMDALAPGAIQSAGEVRKRQESSWRTADDENAGNVEIAAELLRGSGATDDQVRVPASAIGSYFELYTVIPGVRRILDELEDSGILQGVVSN